MGSMSDFALSIDNALDDPELRCDIANLVLEFNAVIAAKTDLEAKFPCGPTPLGDEEFDELFDAMDSLSRRLMALIASRV